MHWPFRLRWRTNRRFDGAASRPSFGFRSGAELFRLEEPPILLNESRHARVGPGTVAVAMALAAAMGSAAEPSAYRWSNVAIGGGGYVTGLVAHPSEPGLIYLRTDVGGAYRWEPDGERWVPITDGFGLDDAPFYSIDGLAVDPSSRDTVYFAAGNGSPCDVFKSSDRGRTWLRTGLAKSFTGNGAYRTAGECIQVDPRNPDVVYCGTRRHGLWRSVDGARSWQKVDELPDDPRGYGVRCVVFGRDAWTVGTSVRSQSIYAGVKRSGVHVSRDGGASFARLPGGPADCNRIVIESERRFYVASEEGLHRWDDGGWTDLSPDRIGGFNALSIDPGNPRRLLCAPEYLAKPVPEDRVQKRSPYNLPIYYSEDGGATWRDVTRNKVRHTHVAWTGENHFSAATAAVAFDPADSRRVWFTDWYGVWMTPDVTAAPVNWHACWQGLEEMVVFQVVSPSAGANLLTGLADNDGMRHVDLTWYRQKRYGNPSLQETTGIDFCERDPMCVARAGSTGWGVRGGGGFSRDNGATWTPFPGWPTDAIGYRCALSAENPDAVVILPIASLPRYTIDNGRTFRTATGAPNGCIPAFWSLNDPLAADRVDGARFYLCAKEGFHRSDDSGATWTRVNTTLPVTTNPDSTVKAMPGRRHEVWVSLRRGGLHRSADGGATFTKIATVDRLTNFAFGRNPPGRNHPAVFVFGVVEGRQGMYRSDDLAQTWIRIDRAENPLGLGRHVAGDRQVFGRVYVGTGGRGVYVGEPEPASDAPATRLVNLSVRARVSAGSETLIAGFVLDGGQARRLLVRGAGPALAGFGVGGVLAAPRLQVFRQSYLLAENNGWDREGPAVAELVAAFQSAGAFPFAGGARDAAVLLRLDPGAYTAQVSSDTGGTGETLVEVFELP